MKTLITAGNKGPMDMWTLGLASTLPRCRGAPMVRQLKYQLQLGWIRLPETAFNCILQIKNVADGVRHVEEPER
eukprot:4372061-Alexandrium_andersonii.AAC.1